MKKLIAISVMTLALTTCSFSATAETTVSEITNQEAEISFIDFLIERDIEMTLLQQQVKEAQDAQVKELRTLLTIEDLKTHAGKTWYVFSGSTPRGWDCSGLVLWFYKHFDVELEHSATKQMFSGEFVDSPQLGDIVAFSHKGYDTAYHNGIYVGEGMFIHAPKVGALTKISSILDYAGQHSTITYTRIDY